MSFSFLNNARSGISLLALTAFLNSQLGLAMNQPQPTEAQQPQEQTTVVSVPVPHDAGLDLTIIEGEGATNVVGKKSSTRPQVRVADQKKEPVEGAVVTFIAPADGASVLFNNGLRTVTVMTDSQGLARIPSMRAVNAGDFQLHVSASFRGQMVSSTISQTNYESSAEASGKKPAGEKAKTTASKGSGKSGLSGGMLGVIIGGGAAAALGIALGMGKKGSSTTPASTTTATIGAGGVPTVGAPH